MGDDILSTVVPDYHCLHCESYKLGIIHDIVFFRLAGSKAFEEETKAPQRKLNHVFKKRQIEYFDAVSI